MPLNIVRAPDTRTLWETFTGRFLEQVGDRPGPSGFAAHAWLAQESQVDLLYEVAVARGVKGWLGPPVTSLRRLAARFDLRPHRIGLLTRRRLIARVASRVADEVGMRDPSRGDGVVRGHMLDALFGELLPEGIMPERLGEALDGLRGDEFARRRNRWIVRSYAGYLDELARRDRVDARQVSALIAARIDAGALPDALGAAAMLHLYGLYMPRSRHRLLSALAAQSEVDVQLYLIAPAADDPERSEWENTGAPIEELDGRFPASVGVQPAPDTQRETEWVVRQVKRLLVEGEVEPHRVAVVARSGREDTGRVHRALRDAGVTATTIVRARLNEIAALKALLALFRGAAANWSYRTLRPVLDNALLDAGVDTRTIDAIAHRKRVEGLEEWEREIERLLDRLRDTDATGHRERRALRGKGLRADSVERDLQAFRRVRGALAELAGARSETDWIALALALLRGEHPAGLALRRRLCEPLGQDDAERWDVVRLDQRGVRHCETLLLEWLELEHDDRPLEPDEWVQLLGRMLEANELSITTPVHKGVQVLEAHDAALLPFAHVFVVHANDGVFPRAISAGGVLSSEERARLCAVGVPLAWRDLELQRERALWRAVTSAGRVRITYRTADATGTPLLPSLLVPAHDPASELPRTRTGARMAVDDPRFVPVTGAQANRRAALAVHAHVAEAAAGPAPEIHPGEPSLLRHAVLAAVAESLRHPGSGPVDADDPGLRPNPWNGWLRDPRVRERLAERFDDEYRWSASSLESYSKLPFQFLLDKVLGYEEAEEAEEDVTPLVFGSAVHDLLERFYRRLLEDLPDSFDGRAEAAFEAACEETLAAARESDEWLGAEVLWEQEWRRLHDQVRHYLQWELPYLREKGERPELIERDFGFGDERVTVRGEDVRGRDAVLRLCGRIDRVDRGPDGYQVLDYKSNYTPGANDYVDGTALQAPLYMQVLENEGRTVSMGYYRSLKPFKDKPTQQAGKIERGSGKYDDALRFALSIPGRIRAGLFEPVRSAKAGSWPDYAAGPEIARSRAVLPDGNRYEDVQPLQPTPASVTDASPADAGPTDAVPDPDEPPRLPFAGPGGEDG